MCRNYTCGWFFAVVFFGPKTIFLDDFLCINDICREIFGEEIIFVDGSSLINIDVRCKWNSICNT